MTRLNDADPKDVEDPWLTVAEIASELRVNPATVRLWVSKRTLPATRAGQRKMLIRRSDLDRMLEAIRSQPPALGRQPRANPHPRHPRRPAAPQPRAGELVAPLQFVRCIEFFLSEREISQEALLAELDAVLAHIREALLVYWHCRQAINARELREP
jgi:excisionase family DNA binding protein